VFIGSGNLCDDFTRGRIKDIEALPRIWFDFVAIYKKKMRSFHESLCALFTSYHLVHLLNLPMHEFFVGGVCFKIALALA
jgi:hypothetical protein